MTQSPWTPILILATYCKTPKFGMDINIFYLEQSVGVVFPRDFISAPSKFCSWFISSRSALETRFLSYHLHSSLPCILSAYFRAKSPWSKYFISYSYIFKFSWKNYHSSSSFSSAADWEMLLIFEAFYLCLFLRLIL